MLSELRSAISPDACRWLQALSAFRSKWLWWVSSRCELLSTSDVHKSMRGLQDSHRNVAIGRICWLQSSLLQFFLRCYLVSRAKASFRVDTSHTWPTRNSVDFTLRRSDRQYFLLVSCIVLQERWVRNWPCMCWLKSLSFLFVLYFLNEQVFRSSISIHAVTGIWVFVVFSSIPTFCYSLEHLDLSWVVPSKRLCQNLHIWYLLIDSFCDEKALAAIVSLMI